MSSPRPGGGLAAFYMLAGHPPARDFLRLPGLAQIVDDQNVAHIALRFGRDIGIALVEIEAVNAYAAGLLVTDQLWPGGRTDVVDFESAVIITALLKLLGEPQVFFRYTQAGGDLRRCR